MPANVASWSMAALGHSITVQEFMANPALQQAIVTAKFLGYVNSYGYAGAASAWFSGNPNLYNDSTNRGGGAASVKAYVDSVLGRMSSQGHTVIPTQAGGTVSAFGQTGAAAIPAARPSFDWWSGVNGTQLGSSTSQANESVGLISAFIGADPELKNLYSEAVANSWSQDKFINALHATSWWATHSDTVRQNLTMKSTDPATWNQTITSATAEVQQLAAKMGVPLSGQNLTNVANSAALFGYNTAQIQSVLSGYLRTISGGWFGGYAGQVQLALKEYAADMGIPVSNSFVNSNVQSIVGGTNSLNAVRASIQSQAALAFPAYADQINKGMTVGAIAAPYANAYSQILEQDPNSITLLDPTLRNVLQHKDGKGQPAVKQLADYEVDLRKNPLWGQTNNARESVMAGATQVLSNLGIHSTDMGAAPQTSPSGPTDVSAGVASQSLGLSGMTGFSTLQGKEALSNPVSPTAATSLAPDTSFTTAGSKQVNK